LTLGVVFLILIMQKWLDNLFPNEYYVEKVVLYIALFLGSGYLYEPLKRAAWKLRGRHEV